MKQHLKRIHEHIKKALASDEQIRQTASAESIDSVRFGNQSINSNLLSTTNKSAMETQTRKQYKLSSRHTYEFTDNKKAYIPGDTVTVPGEALTVQQILVKSKAGINLTGEKYPIYEGGEHWSPDLEKVKHLDLVEKDELLQQTQREIQESKAILDEVNGQLVQLRKNKEKRINKLLQDAEEQAKRNTASDVENNVIKTTGGKA